MFNGAMFREIVLPSSANVNDYIAHIQKEYAALDGKNRTYVSGWEKVRKRD